VSVSLYKHCKHEKIFSWGTPRSRVKDAQTTVRELLATLEKAKRDALRVQNRCDIIARYCAVTEQELRQLLNELEMSNPMPS